MINVKISIKQIASLKHAGVPNVLIGALNRTEGLFIQIFSGFQIINAPFSGKLTLT